MKTLDPVTLLMLNGHVIKEYGGNDKPADFELAEAVIERIDKFIEVYDGHKDIFFFAGLHLCLIAGSKIFEDGNKRTALAATMLFLRRNGCMVFDTSELPNLVNKAAAGEMDFEQVATELFSYYGNIFDEA